MKTKPSESEVETIKGKLKDLVGLPPGDKGQSIDERAAEKNTVPEGGLTSPDAQGLPPHSGTGIKAV